MIKDIYSGDPYIISDVQRRSPYIVDDANDPSNGMVRFRGDRFEIYDSFNKRWVIYTGDSLTLSLSSHLSKVVAWVEKKMAEEYIEEELRKKYPALQTAKDNYDTIKALVQNG